MGRARLTDHPRNRGTYLLNVDSVDTRTRATTLRASGGRVATTSPEEIIERLIASEAKNRLLERTIRELQALYGDEPNASYAAVLVGRIATLEANVQKMARRKAA